MVLIAQNEDRIFIKDIFKIGGTIVPRCLKWLMKYFDQFLTQISATSINEKGENAKILAGKGIKVIQCDVSKDADIENLIEIVEERG